VFGSKPEQNTPKPKRPNMCTRHGPRIIGDRPPHHSPDFLHSCDSTCGWVVRCCGLKQAATPSKDGRCTPSRPRGRDKSAVACACVFTFVRIVVVPFLLLLCAFRALLKSQEAPSSSSSSIPSATPNHPANSVHTTTPGPWHIYPRIVKQPVARTIGAAPFVPPFFA